MTYNHEAFNHPVNAVLLPVINNPFDAGSLTPLWPVSQLQAALSMVQSEATKCTSLGDLPQAADFTLKAKNLQTAIARHP